MMFSMSNGQFVLLVSSMRYLVSGHRIVTASCHKHHSWVVIKHGSMLRLQNFKWKAMDI